MIDYVQKYIDGYYAGMVKFNYERKLLVDYIKREVVPRLESGEVFFDETNRELHWIYREIFL